MKLALGMMSGTSADGISVALCSFEEKNLKILAHQTFPYSFKLSQTLICGPLLTAPEISRLNVQLGKLFADAILKFLKKSNYVPEDISVIGSHGHTIYHGPNDQPRNTLQIGESSMIAERTGIPVVADFRMRDIAAGGSGAPLIPFFDKFFFGQSRTTALQNIGGIANVTIVGKNLPTFAFDNGPGNCLIDWAVQKMTHGRSSFDRDGKIAATGKIDMAAVKKMASHPYFKKRPPKSTGRELFNPDFIPHFIKSGLKKNSRDLISTLTYFTAYTIHQSYQRFAPPVSEIIASGGGTYNQTLMTHLKNLFSPVPVKSLDELGIPTQAKEPAAFAFFALRAIEGKINHLPEGTGATKACILGKIIPSSYKFSDGSAGIAKRPKGSTKQSDFKDQIASGKNHPRNDRNENGGKGIIKYATH